MPAYEITGYHSSRHPFYDSDDELIGADTTDDAYAVVSAAAEASAPYAATIAAAAAKPTTSKFALWSPLLAGAISGLASYSIARQVGIDKPKATNLGIVMGVLSAVGQVMGVWLHNRLVSIKQDIK